MLGPAVLASNHKFDLVKFSLMNLSTFLFNSIYLIT